jgi:3-methyladenine DNA glycosylase Tag
MKQEFWRELFAHFDTTRIAQKNNASNNSIVARVFFAAVIIYPAVAG